MLLRNIVNRQTKEVFRSLVWDGSRTVIDELTANGALITQKSDDDFYLKTLNGAQPISNGDSVLIDKLNNFFIISKAMIEKEYESDSTSLRFTIDEVTMLELCANGDFKVKGKTVANDSELYHAFKEWFLYHQTINPVKHH